MLNQPAGHVEEGESIIAAAMRETLEETAWHFAPSHLLGVWRVGSLERLGRPAMQKGTSRRAQVRAHDRRNQRMHKAIGAILWGEHPRRIQHIERIQCLLLAAPAGCLEHWERGAIAEDRRSLKHLHGVRRHCRLQARAHQRRKAACLLAAA